MRIFALVLFASLAALPFGPLPLAAQTTDTPIHVGVGPVDTAAPVIYAAQAGIYKKYGLNVDLQKAPNGAATISAISGGTLDLGQGAALATVTAFARNIPLTTIGGLSFYNNEHPDYAMLVLASSQIKNPKDLEGQTLGEPSLRDQNTVATYAWLDAHGVDRAKLKFVEIPAAASLAAMEQSRIVASTFYEPFFSSFSEGGKTRVLGYPYDAIGKHFADSVLFGNPKWVADHPDLVSRFLRATGEAAAYVSAHEAEVPQITAPFTGVDPAKSANLRHGIRGVTIGPADLQPMIDAAAKYGVIDKSFPASQMICGCALKR